MTDKTDETTTTTSQPEQLQERFGNFQKEVDRKLNNQNQLLQDTLIQTKQLLDAINKGQMPRSGDNSAVGDKIGDLLFSDPDAALKQVESQIANRVTERISGEINAANKQNQILNQLVTDYPELSDDSHELTQEAVKIYGSMSKDEQANPISYRLAVQQAALNQGVRPRSKRESSDHFSPRGADSTASKGKTKLAPETLAFAQLMGINTKDAKNIKQLEQFSKRNYNKYQGDARNSDD